MGNPSSGRGGVEHFSCRPIACLRVRRFPTVSWWKAAVAHATQLAPEPGGRCETAHPRSWKLARRLPFHITHAEAGRAWPASNIPALRWGGYLVPRRVDVAPLLI